MVRSVVASHAPRIAPVPPYAMTMPMPHFFRKNSSGSACFTIAALGASDTSVASCRSRRSSIVAMPIWIFRFSHRRVRPSFRRGWPCAVVPLKEPRSSMWAWS